MKVYVVEEDEDEASRVGIYASLELAMAEHPAPDKPSCPPEPRGLQYRPGGWQEGGQGWWWNGLPRSDAKWIHEEEVLGAPAIESMGCQ